MIEAALVAVIFGCIFTMGWVARGEPAHPMTGCCIDTDVPDYPPEDLFEVAEKHE